MAVHIESEGQWRKLLGATTVVVADFHATWCGPCKVIAPTFESLATKFTKPGRVAFAKIDVDAQPAVAQLYGVRAMPTFLVLKSGSVIDTIQGADPRALTAAVDKAVKLATAAAPGAAFRTPGRKLGEAPTGPTAAAGAAGASGGGLGSSRLGRPAGAPVQGSALDLNRLLNALVTFFGLYFVSLFSFDPYMAAQNSRFNVQTPSVPIHVPAAAAARPATTKPAAARPAPPKKFATLADL